VPAKQRHTAKRIFERLRDEHGYGGGYTTVKDYARVRRQQRREVFVPLWHPAGHGQADFGEAVAVIGGGHASAFAFFGGVPRSIVYDNTRLAVVRVLGDGRRQRTRAFSELTSHYLFEDRFGRPGKGNDKGKVENLVGYARRNYLVPLPRAATFEELNAQLEARCRRRFKDRLPGHDATIGERLADDRAAFPRLASRALRAVREATWSRPPTATAR
jgi:transposase